MVLPTLTFTIPSIQDHIELECRLYVPAARNSSTSTSTSTSTSSTSDRPKTQHDSLSGAVIAHPYANLGGCFDDPAVLAATDAFLRAGSVVGTFNFRGAGGSKGSTSWTGTPELADYVSFAGFFTRFLALLAQDVPLNSPSSSSPSSPSSSSPPPKAATTSPPPSQPDPRISLILCGYSYGSRILTHLPSVSAIAARFSPFPSPSSSIAGTSSTFAPGSAEAVIAETAACLAAKVRGDERSGSGSGSNDGPNTSDQPPQPTTTSSSRRRSRHSVSSVGGSEGPSSSSSPSGRRNVGVVLRRSVENVVTGMKGGAVHRSGGDDGRSSKQGSENVTQTPSGSGDRRVDVDLRYVLISPVLPPVGWLTSPRLDRPAPGRGGGGGGGAGDGVVTMQMAGRGMVVSDEWWQYPALVVFGQDDQFTAAKKVRQWMAGLARPGGDGDGGGVGSKATTCELERQGHFWHSREAGARLREAIGDWLARNPAGDALR